MLSDTLFSKQSPVLDFKQVSILVKTITTFIYTRKEKNNKLQWNPIDPVINGTQKSGHIKGVALLKEFFK